MIKSLVGEVARVVVKYEGKRVVAPLGLKGRFAPGFFRQSFGGKMSDTSIINTILMALIFWLASQV
jgi:hypothetical protein